MTIQDWEKNKADYFFSIQTLPPEERKQALQLWLNNNPQPLEQTEVVEEEEVKTEGAATQEDADVAPTEQPEASEKQSTVSIFDPRSLDSLSQDVANFGASIQSQPVDRTEVINNYLQKEYEGVPKAGEIIEANDYQYKYEADVDNEGNLNLQVLYKGPEDEEFINASEKARNNPKNIALQNAEASILSQLGFLPEEIKEQAVSMMQPQQSQPQDFDPSREGIQSFDDVLFYDYGTQGSELDREIVESKVEIAKIKEQKAQTRLEQVLEESPDARRELEELYAENRVNYEKEKAEIQRKIDNLPAGNIEKLKEYQKELSDLEEKYSKVNLLESKGLRGELDKILADMRSEIISRSLEAATIKPEEQPSMLNIVGKVFRESAKQKISIGQEAIALVVGDVLDPVDKDLLIQQDFYKKAKEIYANKNGVDVDTVTDEDVFDIVKDMYIQKFTEEEKTKLYEDLSKDHVNNWLGGTKSFKDIFGDEEKEQKENLLAAYKDLDLRKEELVNALGVKAVFNNHMESLDLINRTYSTEEEVAAAREKLRLLALDTRANINIVNNSLDSVSEKVKTTADQKLFANLYQRNYGFLTELGGRTSAMALDFFVNGSLEVSARLGITDLILAANPFSPDPILAKKLGIPTQGRMFTDNATRRVDGLIETINEEMRIPKTFSESWASGDWRDWGSALMTSAGQQIPIYAVLMGTGGAGLPLIGLATAGNKFREMQKEIDLGTADYNIFQMYTTALLTGASAVATEYVTKGMLKRLKFDYKNNFGFKEGFNETLENYITGAGRWAKDMGEEIPSEMLDQLVGNFADKYILEKEDVNLFDGLGETAFSTLWTAGVFVRAPLIGQQLMMPFRSKQSFQIIGENTAKIKELMNELNTNKNLDAEAVNQIKDQINQLTVENMKALKIEFDRLDKMTDAEKKVLLENKAKEYEIKRQMKKISENNSYTDDQKKLLLNEKRKQLYDIGTSSVNVLAKYVLEENKQKNMPKVEQDIETVKRFAGEDNVTVIDTEEEFAEKTGATKDTDAFIDPETGEIFINKSWAAKVGAVTAGNHELLHKIIRAKMDSDPAAAVQLVEDFKNTLSRRELDIVQKRIDEQYRYNEDGTERAIEEYAEEYLTVFSDAIGKGNITWSDNLSESFLRLGKKLINFFRGKGFDQIEFKTGRDVYNFIRDYQANIKKGKLTETGQKMLTESEQFIADRDKKTQTKKPSITQRGQEFIDLTKEGVYTNEDLVNIINSPSSNQTDRFGAMDAVVENNWPVISKGLKFNPTGSIPMDAVKTAVTEQMQGIFPGRNKELLADFNPETAQVNTYIGSLMRQRQAEILERAKQIGGVTQEGTSIDSEAARQVVAKAPTTTTTKEAKVAKKPTETVKYSDAIIEKAGVKDKAELEAKITEATKESFKDVDVERFGQTKDVPPAVAEIYGNMLGLNPETISDKTRTYQNYDEAGLNAAQRFLLANATSDFSRLPKTKDETTTTGRGTFIPKNMKDALYTDGRLTGTLKDYMDLIRSKPTGKLYRDSKYAQLIRGLLNTHIRNRMFEDLVKTTPERLRGGAMFSKTQSDLLGSPSTTQVQNLGKVISELNAEELSNYMNNFDAFVDAIAVDDYNVESAFNEVYGADFLTKKNGDPLAKKTDLINEWVKIRQSGKGVKDFSKQTPSKITMRDYLYQAFEEQTESEVVENILGIKKGGVNFRSKDQIMGYVNLMNNYIASKYGKLNDKEIAEFVINELAPSLSAGAKVGGNDFMWKLNQDTGLLGLVPSTIDGRKGIRPSVFANLKQVSQVLIEPFLSEAGKNKLTYDVNKPLWEGKPLKKGQVAQKVNTYVTSLKETGGIKKELLDKSAEFAQQKIETIVDFLNWYKSQKSNKEITVDNLGMAFRGFNGDMTALVRAAARVDSFAGDGTGPQRYEHNPPARTMLVRMAEYVNGDITEQQLRDYFSNYTVSIIPKLMDDVINERYKDTSPLVGSRYYNAFTYGRFPFAMTKYTKQEDGSYKKTVVGEYQKQAYENATTIKKANRGMAPNDLMSKTSTNEQIINDLGVFDNALNEARRPDAPVKKIRVFDFDDTLAKSKSKVLYTVPNVEGGFSEGATNLKAIFMVGGPGAGKTNVGKGLQLGRRGYKVVNQDIALEAMKAESGLPAKESDYTAEQRSLRSKLGAAARKAAVAKFDKYAAAGNGMVIDGTGASYNATTKKIKALEDAGYEVHMVVATTPLETAIERNKARAERSLPDFVVRKTYDQVQESLAKYREDFGDRLYEINTETIEYGKPLPNEFLQQVYNGINRNKVGKVDASNFATEYDVLESQGAEFDFREFSRVIEGEKGPLFSVAQKIAAARGTDDIFILTARPADAAKPIQEFMKANGIDIPLKNITGLGDGTAAAKGRWIAGKAAEGYNDFYFADDAVKNVQAVKDVLSQVDVKSKVQQAKFSKTEAFDRIFNDIIEQTTGIESYKDYSAAKAKTIGASKGKFDFLIPPSAEDFVGLLYRTLSKGKVGDAQMAFYKNNLIDPYNRAEMAISQAKVAAGRDYKELKKQFKNIPKTLEKETGIAKYSYQHAIRTYIWDSQGLEVPGLSKRDQKRLTEFVKADPELQAFADQLVNLQKGKPYPQPDKNWTAGNITTDVISGINKVNRAEYLQEWQENVDIIFSEKNMNKLEAAFGAKYVEALKDSLRAMKSGSNRPLGGDRVSNQILDWLNNSVGAIMFLNTRSAVLQTISAVNFINWGDNNILKAGKAFANQKQFWSDFLTLMNSDYLLERRDGLKINVSESEIADAVEGSSNKVQAAISYLLNKGFVFTRYADSFAIASGGATFYRNRIESLVKQGMDRKAAEQQAFEDFRLIAEENQQSSSPMRISQQQRSLIGRIVLQFGNTQLQYVRIQKRAVQDLINGRGDWRSNISKIVYYGAIQNLLFNALQSGLSWAMFDDDEEDEELTEKNKEQKLERTLNGAIDSQLKGLGIQGAVIAGVKNALITIAKEADKKSPKFEEALDDLLSIAPALGSKIRKLKSAARTVSWNRKEIKEKGFSLDNPAYLAGAQTISAIFNIPLDRAAMKLNNMRNILNPATQNWQKVALALGWSTWDVGLPYFGLAEDKPVLTETEKQAKKLFDLNKSDQVKMLLDLGLTKKEIRALTKEEQRVDKIIKLQNKKKNGKDKP